MYVAKHIELVPEWYAKAIDIVRLLKASHNIRLLDLGAGWGDVSKELFCHFPVTDITCVDQHTRYLNIDKEDLNAYRANYYLHKSSRPKNYKTRVIRADISDFCSLQTSVFDLVLLVDVLHFLRDNYADVLAQIKKTMHPQSILFISTADHEHDYAKDSSKVVFSKPELLAILSLVGFKVLGYYQGNAHHNIFCTL